MLDSIDYIAFKLLFSGFGCENVTIMSIIFDVVVYFITKP